MMKTVASSQIKKEYKNPPESNLMQPAKGKKKVLLSNKPRRVIKLKNHKIKLIRVMKWKNKRNKIEI